MPDSEYPIQASKGPQTPQRTELRTSASESVGGSQPADHPVATGGEPVHLPFVGLPGPPGIRGAPFIRGEAASQHVGALYDMALRLREEYLGLAGVSGFVIGGSLARGFADDWSDLEVYVYHDGRIPEVAEINRVIQRVGGRTTRSADVHWTHPAWGVHSFFGTSEISVELGYRDIAQTRDRLGRYLAGDFAVREGIHDVPFGWYPSGLAACLAECRVLADPAGAVATLQQEARQFPEALVKGLLSYHSAEAAEILRHKMLPAHQRGDAVHFQAALARVVRSMVVGIFTVNRLHYPGDKWNQHYLRRMWVPAPDFLAGLDAAVRTDAGCHDSRAEAVEWVGQWSNWLNDQR